MADAPEYRTVDQLRYNSSAAVGSATAREDSAHNVESDSRSSTSENSSIHAFEVRCKPTCDANGTLADALHILVLFESACMCFAPNSCCGSHSTSHMTQWQCLKCDVVKALLITTCTFAGIRCKSAVSRKWPPVHVPRDLEALG